MRSTPTLIAVMVFLGAFVAEALAEPRVDVAAGFDGRWRRGGFLPIRVDVTNDGPEWSGLLVLRQMAYSGEAVRWEFPLTAPPNSRRRTFFVIAPLQTLPMGTVGAEFQFSLDTGVAGSITSHAVEDDPNALFVVTIGDEGVPNPGLRAALDPSTAGRAQVAVLRPEELPPDAVAWEGVDVIVVNAAAAHGVAPEVWRAIADRLLLGGVFVSWGAEPHSGGLPPELLAGTPAGPAVPTTLSFARSAGLLPALPFEPAADGKRLVVSGDEQPWAVVREHGMGRVVTVGLNLNAIASLNSGSADPWGALLELPPGSAGPVRPPSRASTSSALLEGRGANKGLSAKRLAAMGCSVALVLLGFAAYAAFAWRRSLHDKSAWLRAPLVPLMASLLIFVAGALLHISASAPRPLEIRDVFLGQGRERSVLHFECHENVGTLQLPGWPARLVEDGSAPWSLLFARGLCFRLGPHPSVEGLRPSLTSPAALDVVRWGPATGSIETAVPGRARNGLPTTLDSVLVQAGSVRYISQGALAPGMEVEMTPFAPGLHPEPVLMQVADALMNQGQMGPAAFVLGVSMKQSSLLEARNVQRLWNFWIDPP